MCKKTCSLLTRHSSLPVVILFLFSITSCQKASQEDKNTTHVKVFYEEDKYGGWPANWGIWSWNNEILVGFTKANHKERKSHTFDRETSRNMFARSKDGGQNWTIEDGFEHGITEQTVEHQIGKLSKPATVLEESIDFSNPNLAFTFRMVDMYEGPTSFYYSYDRGKTWKGAHQLNIDFGSKKPAGIVSRTDYIIDGKHSMTAFLTVGFIEGDTNWREVACVRTLDGGLTWKLVSWIGPEKINSIMPSSIRLDHSNILTMIRRTKPPEMVAFVSEDNGSQWKQLNNPVKMDSSGNPPALLKLKDGRLCLVYGIRESETMPDGIGMYVVYSSDNGQSWSTPKLLRGKDGAVWDIGYPRSIELPNGNIVAIYYYNNADAGDKNRYIAATIFNPKNN